MREVLIETIMDPLGTHGRERPRSDISIKACFEQQPFARKYHEIPVGSEGESLDGATRCNAGLWSQLI